MLFFDVFSSCCGGGKTREVKLLHLTDEERFKLAESYTKASLPNNKHFCSILTNNFKPQVEPHFGSNRDAKEWNKAEKRRRLRAIDRALKEYQESMPSKSNEGEHLKSIKRLCHLNLMKVSQAQLVQVAAVIHQSGVAKEGKRDLVLYQVNQKGERKDLAEFAQKILSRPERANGVVRVPYVNPKKEKVKKDTDLASRHYMVRKKDQVRFRNIFMEAVGFPEGAGNGLKSHYHFIFDPELGEKFAFSKITCNCEGCEEQMKRPIATRYTGPRDKCYLWEIFDKKDGSGSGFNDWGLGHFKERKDCNEEELHLANADTLREIGRRYEKEIVDGAFCAYDVDDPNHEYYIAKVKGDAKMAETDMEFEFGKEKFRVRKGDYYCHGLWLDKLPRARNWFTMTDTRRTATSGTTNRRQRGGRQTRQTVAQPQECIIKLENVINANLNMAKFDDENNPLPNRLHKDTVQYAKEKGAWCISDEDHTFLVEETKRRAIFDYDQEKVAYVRDDYVASAEWTWRNDNDDDESDIEFVSE